RPQLVFLTFVVVVGTLLLHGLTLPWLIGRLGVRTDQVRSDAIAAATARDKAARAAADRLDEVLATTDPSPASERAAEALRGWNTRRRNAARERLRRDDPDADTDETASAAFRRMRLEMLAAERAAFIAERDGGHIDDQVLRAVLHGLDLEEATLNLD
ncbi:MAG TPA: Na+/H+ antiporter, partial [Mycobacterium sp.]|nr:Na+/H+ antiporter [Mycobacterium sp.]